MKLQLFSVRDSKVDMYSPPMAFRAHGEAIRWFQDMATDQQSNIAKHPEDFMLFELGTFDDETGQIQMLVQPHPLGLAVDQLKNTPSAIEAARSFHQ